MSDKRFPSPFEVDGPEGIDGWEELYPYSLVFSDDLKDYEGQPVLVLGFHALGCGDDALGLGLPRTGHLGAQSVQLPSLSDSAGRRHRLPGALRLPVLHTGHHRRRGAYREPSTRVHGACGPLLHELGRPVRKLVGQGQGHHCRDRGARFLPGYRRWRICRSSPTVSVRGPDPACSPTTTASRI